MEQQASSLSPKVASKIWYIIHVTTLLKLKHKRAKEAGMGLRSNDEISKHVI